MYHFPCLTCYLLICFQWLTLVLVLVDRKAHKQFLPVITLLRSLPSLSDCFLFMVVGRTFECANFSSTFSIKTLLSHYVSSGLHSSVDFQPRFDFFVVAKSCLIKFKLHYLNTFYVNKSSA